MLSHRLVILDRGHFTRLYGRASLVGGGRMRASLRWGLILSVAVTSQAVGQTRARFSADAITLLEQLTQGYDLNGRRMPSGKVDDAILARLAKSTDPNISE